MLQSSYTYGSQSSVVREYGDSLPLFIMCVPSPLIVETPNCTFISAPHSCDGCAVCIIMYIVIVKSWSNIMSDQPKI